MIIFKNYLNLIFMFFIYFITDIIIVFLELENLQEFLIIKNILSLIAILISYFIYRKSFKKDLQNFKKTTKSSMKIAFKYWLGGVVVMIASNFLLQRLGFSLPSNETTVEAILKLSPILGFIYVAVVAPVLEEIIFRKTFKEAITNKYLFVIISALIFGLLHIVGSFTTWTDLLFLIPYSALGVSFAMTTVETDSIFPSMIMHIAHNSLAAYLGFLAAGVIL